MNGDADTLVGSIIDRLEALKESVSIDKVEVRSSQSANTVNNQVNAVRTADNEGIQ